MATFSTSSVRQLFVANASSGTTAGSFGAATVTDGELSFTIYNALGKLVSSPRIPLSKIRSVKSTAYSPKCLRKDAISFSTPVVGETYIIRFVMRQWGSGSAENQYFKHVGAYKAKTGDDAEDIVDAMIANAAVNFSRESSTMFTFSKENSGADAKLIVTEYAQPWVKGKQQGRPLDYTIQFVKINDSGSDVYDWGTVTNIFKAYPGVGTNHEAQDMEYFYMGERGDVYRNVGYPFTFDTQYIADPTANYSIIDIAYYTNEPHNSGGEFAEKVVTILCKEAATTAQYAIQIAIAGAINTATGATTVPLLVNTGSYVILKAGSLGTAGNTEITSLTSATKYVIYTNPGTPNETKGYVKGDGTVSATESDIANLVSTKITGLTNGVTYFVKVY